jgi:hypothetical protein
MTSPVFHLVCVRIGAGKTTCSGNPQTWECATFPDASLMWRRRGMQLGGIAAVLGVAAYEPPVRLS